MTAPDEYGYEVLVAVGPMAELAAGELASDELVARLMAGGIKVLMVEVRVAEDVAPGLTTTKLVATGRPLE